MLVEIGGGGAGYSKLKIGLSVEVQCARGGREDCKDAEGDEAVR